MIQADQNLFVLSTNATTYAFAKLDSGHLEHLYYGVKIAHTQGLAQTQGLKSAFGPGNTIAYSESIPQLALEVLPQELSSRGKGDVREPFVSVTTEAGASTSDFKYASHALYNGLGPTPEWSLYEALPLPHLGADLSSAEKTQENSVETLEIILHDAYTSCALKLYYTVFPSADCIVRRSVLVNNGQRQIHLNKLMSQQLDLPHSNLEITSFSGAWAREMHPQKQSVSGAMCQLGASVGVSSNRMNPFFMLHSPKTTESAGACYGFNLLYSGDWHASVQVNSFGATRVLQGVRPDSMKVPLLPGDSWPSPAAVLSFSHSGFSQLSRQMHHFVQRHIVRGTWQYKSRPVLINSWEAFYFNFNQRSLLQLAKRAKNLGIELFVLDDGWFGKRRNDQAALGDWSPNLDKLPKGLKGLGEQLNRMGLDFGIWVEPEMVNPDSDLYRQHPEWALQIPDQEQSLGRHQMILDLSQPAVQEHLYNQLSNMLKNAPITYVKWDMNRIMTDVYSPMTEKSLSAQSGLAHRYVLGLYALLTRLTEQFPHVLFESCASGGNRFDLGMLCYMPQIWASDNTDALSRRDMQTAYSFGYPPSTMGSHVSDVPNHQTLRQTPLATRQTVASFGLLGYELNLAHQSAKDLNAIKAHIAFYKQWRQVLQFGTFYRIDGDDNPEQGQSYTWIAVSPDKRRAVAALVQGLMMPNAPDLRLVLKGLDESLVYRVSSVTQSHTLSTFGDLVNAVSPIPLPKGSLRFQVAEQFYPIPGEEETYQVSGALLMHGGIRLKQGFCGMGFNDQVRLFQDFASRIYVLEARGES